MTRTRYPGNPDWHPVPPRCSDCGRFAGGPGADLAGTWEKVNPYDDLPLFWAFYCEEHTDKPPFDGGGPR